MRFGKALLACPFLAIFLLLTLVPAAAPAGGWQGRETIENGIARIVNPATPMEAPRTIAPRELWRLGGESEEEEEIFGFIDAILCDEEGEVYILDGQLSEIRVFSPQGEHLRTLGAEGEGPGEFRNAVTAFFLPGGRIGVAQMMPTRIAVLGREGAAHADLLLPGEGGMQMLMRAQSRGDRVLLGLMTPSFADGKIVTTQSLLALDGEGKALGTLLEQSEEQAAGVLMRISDAKEEDFSRHWELGPDGRIYIAPYYGSYRIHVLDPEGKLERLIERDYESVKRSQDEIESLRESQSGGNGGFARVEVAVPPYQRDINALIPRDGGELWVASSRGEESRPDGAIGVFDVFDAEGRFACQLSLEADYDPKHDDFIITSERLFVIKEAKAVPDRVSTSGGGSGGMMMMVRRGTPGGDDEDEEREARPLEIICYELAR